MGHEERQFLPKQWYRKDIVREMSAYSSAILGHFRTTRWLIESVCHFNTYAIISRRFQGGEVKRRDPWGLSDKHR
jgi:hypothetical protein